jgi:hypothetical protein
VTRLSVTFKLTSGEPLLSIRTRLLLEKLAPVSKTAAKKAAVKATASQKRVAKKALAQKIAKKKAAAVADSASTGATSETTSTASA